MALIRFRPFSQELSSDLTDIHAQVNRLFDGFLGQPNGSGKIERVWAPTADMYETKTSSWSAPSCRGSARRTFICP